MSASTHQTLLPNLRRPLSRRDVLRQIFGAAGGLAASSVLAGCGMSQLPGNRAAAAPMARAGGSPFAAMGELQAPDANGVRLPAGFSSRVIARSGEKVGSSAYAWHINPDGASVFAQPDGGWVYVCNSETTPGGVGAIRFGADGEIVDAYRILDNTANNCAGGKTPWGTWLSCEESGSFGQVYECNPLGSPLDAVVRPMLGRMNHEAVAVDPVHKALYLTEDNPTGRLYRFVPSASDWPEGASRPALQSGVLEALQVVGGDSAPRQPMAVSWVRVAEPALLPAQQQVPEATSFNGGEGIWFHAGYIYFSTKGDNRIWALDTEQQTLEILYDANQPEGGILTGVDNVTVSEFGDVLVAEDGGDLQLCVILPDRSVKPVLQMAGHDGSEITGPCFSPDGTRLYFSSQRGPDGGSGGVTYEITLPATACPTQCP